MMEKPGLINPLELRQFQFRGIIFCGGHAHWPACVTRKNPSTNISPLKIFELRKNVQCTLNIGIEKFLSMTDHQADKMLLNME